ncbi:MAG: hypothetical protein JWO19_4187 [Bryobacterales bacterium]|nr:hypothetical protein [Bryobacterales bacterium]
MKREMKNMIKPWIHNCSGGARAAIVPFAIVAIWATNGVYPSLAQQPAPPTFSSAAEASQNLFQAVQRNDEPAIANILGGPTELSTSRDPGQDKLDRELFVQRYQEMHRLGRESDGSMTLYIGAENWPFPIPLVQKNGAWRFDAETGLKEVVFRRVGENEFTAIAMCHDFVAAEKNYRPRSNADTALESSPASLVARAADGSAASDPVLFHGYYFKVLGTGKKTGGFAFIAYPAQYRSSGVMTFVITKNGVVYEKDLGANTSALAAAMTAFHKDSSWTAAEQ